MEKTGTKSRAGQGLPGAEGPEAQVDAALTGLLAELKGFQAGIETKLKQQEERLTMLDRKTHQFSRPALAAAAAPEAPHQKAFAAYVRSGEDDGLRGIHLEGKSLNTAVNADGGYLVAPETSAQIQAAMQATASLRQVANVVNVEATSYDVIIDRGDIGSAWAGEAAAVAESVTPIIDRISIPLYELAAMPKASQRLLDDSAFDVEGWLAERIADKFIRAEAQAFISGDGVDKPKGFLTKPAVADTAWAWGSLGYVPTGTAGAFGASPDSIITLVYALGARYRANGTFVMNSKTTALVRKLKDSEGRFLWSDGLAAGEPARLMGYRVLIAEDMPDVVNNATAIAFGDFHAGYTIAERPEIRIMRDPFSAKPNVLFYATKRVGGDVSDFAAIKLLKFSVS